MVQHVLKKISPAHEQIVLLHILGRSNIEIAELTNYTKERVSQVLNDPTVEVLKDELRDKARASLLDSIEDNLVRLGAKSVENLAQTVNTRMQVGTKAKQHQDKVGLEILGILGYSKNSGVERANSSGVAMTEENQSKLVSAIERANAVKERHKTVEADYEVIEDEGSVDA